MLFLCVFEKTWYRNIDSIGAAAKKDLVEKAARCGAAVQNFDSIGLFGQVAGNDLLVIAVSMHSTHRKRPML